jgi:phosphoribosylamine--glycine ligase
MDLFEGVAEGTLDKTKIEFDDRAAASIMLVSGGYPGDYEKGKKITGIENVSNCVLFHAGTAIDIESETLKTSGGRVMAVTSYGSNMQDSLHNAYENAKNIKFEGKYFRSDIGFDLKKKEK